VDDFNDRVNELAREISAVEDGISLSDRKRYKIPLLLRIARRVTTFSPGCEVCQDLQVKIIALGTDLTHTPQMTRRNLINYLEVLKSTVKHLKRTHGLAEERQYVKRFLLIGLVGGLSVVVLGLILLGFGITLFTLNLTVPALVIRMIFGCTIGYVLDRRARSRGKVL
jgi:hypothetical protein